MGGCPVSLSQIMDFAGHFLSKIVNEKGNVQPVYVQEGHEAPDSSSIYSGALAYTLIFTFIVFMFEDWLDSRQKEAYKITTFPSQLEETVAKIDADTSSKKPEMKDDNDDESTSKLLLPKLKSKFAKSQTYGSDKIKYQMVCGLYNLAETTVFLLLGFMPFMWDTSAALAERFVSTNSSEITVSLVFLLLVQLLGMVTSLPFELYSTFYIEKKHGFNKQTPGLFFSDKVKSLILTVVIGGPFVYMLLSLIKWGGEHFYIYVWAFMFVFSLFMLTIVPVVIMPLFNKYEPLEDSDLKTKIFELAGSLDFPLTKLFVMDGSKRSSHSNAFMFGFLKNKRIVLFDTLMEQVHDKEILAILGHELGHWKLGHTVWNFVVTQAYFGASMYAFSLCYNTQELYTAFGFNAAKTEIPTIIKLLLFFQTLWAPIDKILSFLTTLNTRRFEFDADKFSVKLGMSKDLQTGLCKISLENLGAMCPDKLYSAYHYSHPPLVDRLAAMMKLDTAGVGSDSKKKD